jgi:transglutaminase-like putative cysteine protease
MKRIAPFILPLLLALMVGQARADKLDSLLTVQRLRAGQRAEALFAPLEMGSSLGLDERADYAFLLANLPLSDLASMEAKDMLDNVRAAHAARESFAWAVTIPEDLWRHYVLPHRISQEPFTRWRTRFLKELEPRLQGMGMSQAALEVNHWCHEQATYTPTDGRDQDPLTTLRAGRGRCEEEMILAIAALRSVGIPARQCYTPYWAHSNDNHAWVEVWTEGAWSYMGACEPAPALGQAWFTDAARRAMLVVSQAYGAVEQGGEPVLKAEGRSTSVNSTAVYGPVKTLRVEVVDAKGRPSPRTRVVFSLFNYGGWMPAVARDTDEAGLVELGCGRGSWLVSTGSGKAAALLHAAPADTQVRLVLGSAGSLAPPSLLEYQPPVAQASRESAGVDFAEGVARGLIDTTAQRLLDEAFHTLMQREDSLRAARMWTARERELDPFRPDNLLGGAPDSMRLTPTLAMLERQGVDSHRVMQLLRRARGNWGSALAFLDAPFYPGPTPPTLLARRLRLLDALSDKDLTEVEVAVLVDHEQGLWNPRIHLPGLPLPDEGDSLLMARLDAHVLPCRIDGESCIPWRGELQSFLARHPELADSPGDKALVKWLRRQVKVDAERDRLGAPLSPAQVLELMRGNRGDVARLYQGLCRARGMAARVDALSGQLQRWDQGTWKRVELFKREKGAKAPRLGQLELVAADSASAAAPVFKDWCLSRWEEDHLEAVDLGWEQPLNAMTFPVELPEGLYVISGGQRRADGSAAVRHAWTQVKAGACARLTLQVDAIQP